MVLVPLALGALVACSNASGPARGGRVTLKFTMVPTSSAVQARTAGFNLSQVAIASLPLTGTNGTLTLDQAWLVVDHVRLESAADTCAGEDHEEDNDVAASRVSLNHGDPMGGDDDEDHDEGECEAGSLAPLFVQVPLEGEGTGQVSVDVPPGTYDEIKLKAGAPDADLLAQIREQFADWPESASLLVVGSFTPTDGDPVPFRVYFDARIKVEREFEDNPLVVEEGGNLTVTVVVDPARWFTNRDGTVDDLSVFDFGTTGEVVPFGFQAGEGCHIERDED
jgi:hypothetical protein